MQAFLLVLILLFQVVNLVLLAAVANLLVRLIQRAAKRQIKQPASARDDGLVDLPQVPNYAQMAPPPLSQGLVLVKDQ